VSGMTASSSSVSITEDELAAAGVALHVHLRRAVQPSNQVSGWRRAARIEAIGEVADWGRKSWAR
jgi:hypothetical protein